MDPRRSLAAAVSSGDMVVVRQLVNHLSRDDDFPEFVRAVWSRSLDNEVVATLLYGLAEWSNDDSTASCRLGPTSYRSGTLARGRADRRIDRILQELSADLLERPDLGEMAVNALIEVSAARVGLESRVLQEYTGPGRGSSRTLFLLEALMVRSTEPSLVPFVSEMSRSNDHAIRESALRLLCAWDERTAVQLLEAPQDQSAPLLDECTRVSALFGRGEVTCWSAAPEILSRASRRFCSALTRIALDSPASMSRETAASVERALHALAEAYSARRADVGVSVAESVLALLATGTLLVNEGTEAELAVDFPASEDWFPELLASPSLDKCATAVLGLVARVASRLSTDDAARRRQAARLEDILARREVSRDEKEQMLAPYR